jgi:hypothetical protein
MFVAPLGFLLMVGLLIAVPVAAAVAWLSSRGRFHRLERFIAFASVSAVATLVVYVASGMLRRPAGLLFEEAFTDVTVLMTIGALLGSLLGALRRSPPRAGSKAP